VSSSPLAPAIVLILEVASGARASVSAQELQLIREYVAVAGFSPTLKMPADRRVRGLIPPSGGRPLSLRDPVGVDEIHYLRHVIDGREWPTGTTPAAYHASGTRLARDPRSGMLVSVVGRFGIHVGIVGRSGAMIGRDGHEWMLVEFRLNTGHWATLMQLRRGLRHFDDPLRTRKRWLRLPS